MPGRDFIRELREADRRVIDRLAAEIAARTAYADVQQTVTAGITHAINEDARLRILADARQHYAQQRRETDEAIDARSQIIDDRMQDHVVRVLRATHATVPHFVSPHSAETPG